MTTSSISIDQSIPLAFVCTGSKQIMKNPVLALCGHLFERTIVTEGYHCPEHKIALHPSDLMEVPSLQARIKAWNQQASEIEDLSTKVASVSLSSPILVSLTHKILDAHDNDIHGLIRTQFGFVSGSKDTSLKLWTTEGKLIQTFVQKQHQNPNEQWVTALLSINENIWASGTRDGRITVWDRMTASIQTRYYPVSGEKGPICKEPNMYRINCIASSFDGKTLYTGVPKYLLSWDKPMQTYQKHLADSNDWVYCVEALSENQLLLVIGSRLEEWNTSTSSKDILLNAEACRRKSPQRPHISAMTPLSEHPTLRALALFDGSVRIFDLIQKKVSLTYTQHQRRVWSAENIQRDLFATSADDRSVCFWDLRSENPVHIIDHQPGRVSSLLYFPETTTLLSASCPDDVTVDSQEKASISFWDLRSLTKPL